MPIFNRDRGDRQQDLTGRRIRLLVVDENPTALEVMGRRLSHAGHDVILARGGIIAMGLLMSHKFDVIVMESDMPAQSGIVTMKKMRTSGLIDPTLPIMLITARSDSAAIVQALDAGADEQISRPFDFDVLDVRIRHLVERSRQLQFAAAENQALDARIARRAVELGEARERIADLQADRQRLVASIQSLHDEIEQLHSRH